MSKKKKKKSTPETGSSEQKQTSASGGNSSRRVALGLLLAGGAVFVYAAVSPGSGPSKTVVPPTARTEPAEQRNEKEYNYFESAEAGKPFPRTLPATDFANPGIAKTYRIAGLIPEVLVQQPCLCGCDNKSDDHKSLLDCYKDDHASHCAVCLKEVILADNMTREGKTPKEIREAILDGAYSNVPIGN